MPDEAQTRVLDMRAMERFPADDPRGAGRPFPSDRHGEKHCNGFSPGICYI